MDTKFQPRMDTDETRSRSAATQSDDRQDACPTLNPRIEINPDAWASQPSAECEVGNDECSVIRGQ